MTNDDLQLLLLSKNPIYIGNVPIYPVSLDEISCIGYSTYYEAINFICSSKDRLKSEISELQDDFDIFDFIMFHAINNEELYRYLMIGLYAICKQPIFISETSLSLYVGDIKDSCVINSSNFENIQAIIRLRNGLTESVEDFDNPSNDKAKEIIEKRNRARQKLQKMKNNSGEVNIADLVSILASGLKLQLDNVMQYDLHQFNNQLNRLKIFDDYEVSVQALLHGVNKEDVEYKHWLGKI